MVVFIKKIIDLTHLFKTPMPVYPGDTPPQLSQINTVKNDGVSHFYLTSNMHVGTHIDTPGHMLDGGKKLIDYPLSAFYGKGFVVNAQNKKVLDEDLLDQKQHDGDIAIFFTGHDKKFYAPDYFTSYPAMTENLAQKLIDMNIKMIALDTPSPDYAPFSIHKLLFNHNILIVENLKGVQHLLDITPFTFSAFPLHLDADASLIRAIAYVG